MSVRLVTQAALEAEVSEFLCRDRYARGERERAGYRNGHAELTVKTTAGPVVLERPKLRGTAQPFASRLLGKGVSRTNALDGWRGVVMTPAAVWLLQELRRQLHHPSRLEEVVDQTVTPAAYHAPSGARVRPPSTRSGTPPPVRTPSPKPLEDSRVHGGRARRRFVLVGENLPTDGRGR